MIYHKESVMLWSNVKSNIFFQMTIVDTEYQEI